MLPRLRQPTFSTKSTLSLSVTHSPTSYSWDRVSLLTILTTYCVQRKSSQQSGGGHGVEAHHRFECWFSQGTDTFLQESACHLAISLHNPIPSERAEIMPAERAFSIVDVVNVLKQYDCFRKPSATSNSNLSHQRRLSFEYIVFGGINDSKRHADALIKLLQGLDCRINLIRFHDIPDTTQGCSDWRDDSLSRLSHLTRTLHHSTSFAWARHLCGLRPPKHSKARSHEAKISRIGAYVLNPQTYKTVY